MKRTSKKSQEKSNIIFDFIVSGKPYRTELIELFSGDWFFVWKYIQVGRQFWKYDERAHIYRLITITYIRSGVAFYTVEDETDEHYLIEGSVNLGCLYPRIIYIKDIADFITEYMPDKKDRMDDICHMFKIMVPEIPSPEVKIDIEYIK